MEVYDDRPCTLGEGALWHPERHELFWFDILDCRLHSKAQSWRFDEYVSAAGWIDRDTLLVASETALLRFSLRDGQSTPIAALEADRAETRSNDGRADPWGGFWIGTMGKSAQPGAGAIYRYYRGALRQLYDRITISNAICFAPDQSCAYFADSADGRLMRVALDAQGWPSGTPEMLVDARGESFGLDGAITAADGTILNAQWGAGQIAHYRPDGTRIGLYSLAAMQCACPALGGAQMDQLFVTTAREGMDDQALAADPLAGQTFASTIAVTGRPEPRVIL